MFSFGFQHAFQRGMEANDQVFLETVFKHFQYDAAFDQRPISALDLLQLLSNI